MIPCYRVGVLMVSQAGMRAVAAVVRRLILDSAESDPGKKQSSNDGQRRQERPGIWVACWSHNADPILCRISAGSGVQSAGSAHLCLVKVYKVSRTACSQALCNQSGNSDRCVRDPTYNRLPRFSPGKTPGRFITDQHVAL